jgi:hypothetical protein
MKYLMIVIFILVACLANAGFATRTLEERLVEMEYRITALEKVRNTMPLPFNTITLIDCAQDNK